MPEPVSVLFVCLGNICRSTMAEGIFRHLAQQPQYKGRIGNIDSCGTGMLAFSKWCLMVVG
jgi:low molecular weight phosphotyrosine protein phosphatase